MKISVADIRRKCPYYDLTEIKGITNKTSMTLLEWMDVKGYKNGNADKVWLFSRFADKFMARRFAIWCARRFKTDVKEIREYINVIEGFYIKGTHKKEQLEAAERAAERTANQASERTVYRAAYWAAERAAYWAAEWAAEQAAYWAAYQTIDWVVNWTVASCKERAAQVRWIKRELKREEKQC